MESKIITGKILTDWYDELIIRNGNTDIDIGTPQVATLQGLCVMGMYRFEIDFQS
jgi:hypothetical protein